MLMRVKPKEIIEPKFEDKPGKGEISHYFRLHTYRCVNCDTKRSTSCKHQNDPKL